MHNIKFKTHFIYILHSSTWKPSLHVVDVDLCDCMHVFLCESGILIASVWLRSHKCSLFHLQWKTFFYSSIQNTWNFYTLGFVTQICTVHLKVFRILNQTDFKIKWTLIQFHLVSVCLFFCSYIFCWKKCWGEKFQRESWQSDGWKKDWILNAMFTRVNKLNAF